ncbi:MAG TPA: monovalent cation:proton antiporter-2 (CPA2) family protein [Burkholderiales bacterium]
MHSAFDTVLVLLAAAVLVVVGFRALRLPGMLGYLLVGAGIGPHGLGLIPDTPETRYLAEFGVVFLMFSIGLEFSLTRLRTMKRIVFGFGSAQVSLTMGVLGVGAWVAGLDWRGGAVLGGVLALSSTAIVSKMLVDRLELSSEHGRQVIGVLLFQDLAVVPLLILIPALARPGAGIWPALALALLKAALVLGVILFLGQRLMRPWFHLVARQKSSELFMLNILFITLGLAYATEGAGLSLALGAFLAGMLISETEYRYQVEDDIKPFRDVLLGLFFVTVGMSLNVGAVLQHWYWVLLALTGVVAGKALLIAGLGVLFGSSRSVALRTALDLAQAGEFGFVLLGLASLHGLVQPDVQQVVLTAMVISMLAAPFIIERSESLVRPFAAGEWMARAMEVTHIAARTMGAEDHVIVCGYGRSGQHLARLLEKENIACVALDLDPQRVREAAAAGETVVYGDAARREVLVAAGVQRAKALVITYADTVSALRLLAQVQSLRPELPVIVRTVDDTDIERLRRAGAQEVVAEIMEGSLMLATHALMLIGVPFNRVLRRIRDTREQRYALFRGVFRGAGDEDSDAAQPRLHSVLVVEGATGAGKSLKDLELEQCMVDVTAVRVRGARSVSPGPDTVLHAGDVVVLRGTPDALAVAEMRLLQG